MAWAHGCSWARYVKVRLFLKHLLYLLTNYYLQTTHHLTIRFICFDFEPILNQFLFFFRSLGDAVAHSAGVISTPEFTERTLDEETDKFIVVATDGLWEFVDNDETVNMVVASKDPTDSVDVLVKEANARWMREEQVIDDTTIITASLFGYTTNS
mmetsp:Transcript_4541/g.6445  ORF Transcript_4541/g.6445 Transcript_4541/m.6445 type:complete len:155 (+) Transcript_4541:195-659(+)